MKKLLLLLLVAVFTPLPLLAQLDSVLLQQVENWRNGEAPPPRLLKFPDGKINELPICGLRTIGSDVRDYISRIDNPELLAVLLLDHRAEPETVRAAASQLIMLRGTSHVARLLAEQDQDSLRSELAVLVQLLRSPYIAVQVARISKEDLELAAAERALEEMRSDLEAGIAWSDAYRKAADKHPDLKDRAKDPTSVRTLVSYLYDSVVSPSAFDIVCFSIASTLPRPHLEQVTRAGRGTYIIKTADAVYLYHVKQCYNEAA